MTPHERGRAGEAMAASYLQAHGYQLLEKNFRTPHGEVDIVAVYDQTLVFVEVKSWRTMEMTELSYAVNKAKRARIRSVAAAYRRDNPSYRGCRVRFDLLFLPGDKGEIVHLTDVF